ncbi:MAG TPA: Rrf2 family transcriptional regulator [Burkholderiaceae bacterium]|nr:Rrf2 family transcriptional regulator [Burkholderiaceae bacterium]
MRLTQHTDYAMRLLMYLGQHPDRLCTIAEVAGVYNISVPHLMKITHRLGQQGWIETVRGKNGGMRLAHPADSIRLGDVIRDTENDFNLVECFDAETSTCLLQDMCHMSHVIAAALQKFMQHLDQYTLADIIPAKSISPNAAPGVLRRSAVATELTKAE